MFVRTLAAVAALTMSVVAAADHIVLQVENFEGPWRRQTNISKYLGDGFCTSNAKAGVADTVMQGAVDIESAGPHVVWVRAYTSENSKRALRMEVNGTLLAITHTGSTRHWVWEEAGELDLPAGACSVVVHDAADGFESADAVLLTDRKDFDPDMLDEEITRWDVLRDGVPEEADPIRFNIEACCAASQGRRDPESREAWDAARPGIRDALGRALGLDPMPEKTPLNARVTGRVERDLYFIENVVFESRPNFLVTANVYIPKNVSLPAPAVVVSAGHDMNDAKNCPTYQMGQLGLVRQGFIVIAHDPIGQGERKVPGFSHPLGYGSLLVGQTNEGYIVWDTIRVVDYLCTRDDVDASRIGLTGNSGGGENTFYTMPFDERIQAGAASCFVCSYEQWIRHGGNHCICNHFPGIVHAMEEFEIIGLNAPRPFMFVNGAKDPIFPIDGTRDTLRRARGIYGLYDVGERVDSAEAPLPHGWAQPLREACYGWLAKWLLDEGDGSPIPEAEYEAEDAKSPDLLCFDGGNIPAESDSVVTINRRLADSFRGQYAELPASTDAWTARATAWRAEVWNLFGGRPEAPAPQAVQVATFDWKGTAVETLILPVEPDMVVPAIFMKPGKAAGAAPGVVYVRPSGDGNVQDDTRISAWLDAGCAVLVLEPRGYRLTGGKENHLTSDGICLGRPLFAQQVWDVVQAVEYLGQRGDVDGKRVRFWGSGKGALLGIFAGALDQRLERIVADRPLASYRFFIENDQPQPISLCVPNVLKTIDVAQAVALAGPAPILVTNPVGYGKVPLTEAEAVSEMVFASGAYGLLGSVDALAVHTGDDGALEPDGVAFLTSLE
ncbi:MAG: hypothetical protein GY851_11610 [bacterium]|nr:hypothetical protein [bacterium]